MEGLSTKFSNAIVFDGPWTLSITSNDQTMLQPGYELRLIVYGDGNQNGQTNLLTFDDKKLEPNSICDFKVWPVRTSVYFFMKYLSFLCRLI